MDEDSKIEEFAEAAELEAGDAKKAWSLLSANIDGTNLPSWVKAYVKRSAEVVADFDTENGDQAVLAHQLGFYKEPKRPEPVGYDYDHILEWFIDRMTEDTRQNKKTNISRTAREYTEEVMNMNGSPDAVRKAYEKARVRFEAQKRIETEFQQLVASRMKD